MGNILYIEEFRKKSSRYAKDFKKFSKKMDKKSEKVKTERVFGYIEKLIMPIFKKEVSDKIWPNGDFDQLPSDVKNTYVFGLFVSAHSQALVKTLHDIYNKVIEEVQERIDESKS